MARERDKSKKKTHVLRWVREQVGLSQGELGKLIGSTQPTIQSIELGRLALSERFAYRLQEQFGLPAKWFLANNWENTRDPTFVRSAFHYAGLRGGEGDVAYFNNVIGYRVLLLRGYLLERKIVDTLGFEGCKAAGLDTILRKECANLLEMIQLKVLRDSVYQEHLDETGDLMAALKIIEGDCRQLRQYLKELKSTLAKKGPKADGPAQSRASPLPQASAPWSP